MLAKIIPDHENSPARPVSSWPFSFTMTPPPFFFFFGFSLAFPWLEKNVAVEIKKTWVSVQALNLWSGGTLWITMTVTNTRQDDSLRSLQVAKLYVLVFSIFPYKLSLWIKLEPFWFSHFPQNSIPFQVALNIVVPAQPWECNKGSKRDRECCDTSLTLITNERSHWQRELALVSIAVGRRN